MPTNSREKFFKNIRSAVQDIPKKENLKQERGVLPNYADLSGNALFELFVEKARNAQAAVHVMNDKEELPNEIFSHAFCGVAETGTIVMLSSPENPTSQNFLPEKHFVMLNKKNIVPYYEDAWDLIRAQGKLPRCVNFITGPSRTGDIEQKVEVGIHGPKELIIFMEGKDLC